jgi:nicotinamidase/pyrazinamidase
MEALLVMCPQNSYLDSKGSVYLGEKAEIMRVRLLDYISDFSGKIFFFLEKRGQADSFFANDKTHSIVNTFDYRIERNLKKFASIKIEKIRYSGFFQTDFEKYLKMEKIKDVTIIGLETHTSILFTAEELCNREIHVRVIEPLTASRDDYMHNVAISLMVNHLGVKLGK